MEHATFTLLNDAKDGTPAPSPIRYEEDLHGWALEQAALIKAGRFSELDVANLADEVSDVARREVHELESRLSVVVQHLLNWDFQQKRRSASWARSIREQRRQVSRLLQDSRGLTSKLGAVLEEAYIQGRVAALNETKLRDDALPTMNPYSWDDIMTRPVEWPEL